MTQQADREVLRYPAWEPTRVPRRQPARVADGQDAKFSVPRLRPDTVTHRNLVETARSSSCRLVAVTAPAGYGKSTFLVEWAAAEDRRVAWVSLDRFDDDPAALLLSLACAFRQAGLGSAALVAGMAGCDLSVLGRAAPRLAPEFRASPVPFVLMLDDLHQVRSPRCHDVLGAVISAIPQGSQLVAASRSEQPLLPRLRAEGDALEFGPGDLALDEAGARQIFANAQVSLTSELAALMTKRTEGWPVGLRLAALAARGSNGQAEAVTGNDRYVADYLYREAVSHQPTATQRFMRRTAVLDQLCAPLCDAILRSSAAAIHLRRMEAQGLFLTPLDRRRQLYRYHALFREFLLGELRRTEPDIIVTLHQRAAEWYESEGSPAQAVEHLLHTPDSDRAIRLVAKLTVPACMTGQLANVQRWCRTISEAEFERHPLLAVHRCFASVLTGDVVGALRWAAVVDVASVDLVPENGSVSFGAIRAMLRAHMCTAGPGQMMAEATFAVAHEPATGPWRDTALWLVAEAQLLAGQVDKACTLFAEASNAAATFDNSETVVICESQLAWLAMDRGKRQEAADRLELAHATIEEKRLHDHVLSIPAFAAAARLALHSGDLNEMRRLLTQAMRARSSATYVLPYHAVRLRLQLAKVYHATADPAPVRQLLGEIDDILTHRPALGVLVDEVKAFRSLIASSAAAGTAGRLPLTRAELRLLPYLATHLTADRIAERLFLSSHTVKTEIKSIYRKLGASGRNDAVQKATAIGLLST